MKKRQVSLAYNSKCHRHIIVSVIGSRHDIRNLNTINISALLKTPKTKFEVIPP